MARVAAGGVGPGQDHPPQGLERGPEARGRPGPARTALEEGIADDDPRLALELQADLILDMPRRVPDPHDRAREALYVSFADKEGRSLLRVHFDRSHDEAGRLLGERLEAFETLRARHGRFVHPDDG